MTEFTEIDDKFDQVFAMFDMLIEISEYRSELYEDLSDLSSQDFIDKWQTAYDRVMRMKAFL
jgi:hypothetical protein